MRVIAVVFVEYTELKDAPASRDLQNSSVGPLPMLVLPPLNSQDLSAKELLDVCALRPEVLTTALVVGNLQGHGLHWCNNLDPNPGGIFEMVDACDSVHHLHLELDRKRDGLGVARTRRDHSDKARRRSGKGPGLSASAPATGLLSQKKPLLIGLWIGWESSYQRVSKVAYPA